MHYLVETGLNGEPACFSCSSSRELGRGASVICRTARGVEAGRVRARLNSLHPELEIAGQILRPMSSNDRLIAERLERFRQNAVLACCELLQQHGSPAVLLDAEQLFDGENLFFYFLGPVDAAMQPVLAKLAEEYQQKVRFRQFADRLSSGCGPGCGTRDSGCSPSGGCGSCGAAGGCGAKSASRGTAAPH